MRKIRFRLVLLMLIVLTTGASGCQLLKAMPTTTWKLNRGPALDEGQAYFSIPDPDPQTDK
jgi:hypothetical protein